MAFLDNLIGADGEIRLYKFDGKSLPAPIFNYDYDKNSTKVCFLDLETTGLDKKEDKIIELAVKVAAIDKQSGELIGILDEYQSFEDPKEPINEKATRVNGITNEMVEDQSIDWEAVSTILNQADIIVAHNAAFDRAFMDRYLPISQDKVWACSFNDIDWENRGFNSRGQEPLCIWHGFYFDSHRAMSDVDALIHLVTHDTYVTDKPIMELIDNASKPVYKISAIGSPYETKDALKAREYSWNGEDRYWWKNIDLDEVEDEKEWLSEIVYEGSFQGTVLEIVITDKYK